MAGPTPQRARLPRHHPCNLRSTSKLSSPSSILCPASIFVIGGEDPTFSSASLWFTKVRGRNTGLARIFLHARKCPQVQYQLGNVYLPRHCAVFAGAGKYGPCLCTTICLKFDKFTGMSVRLSDSSASTPEASIMSRGAPAGTRVGIRKPLFPLRRGSRVGNPWPSGTGVLSLCCSGSGNQEHPYDGFRVRRNSTTALELSTESGTLPQDAHASLRRIRSHPGFAEGVMSIAGISTKPRLTEGGKWISA